MSESLNQSTPHNAKCQAVFLSSRLHGAAHAKWLHSHLEISGSYEEAINIALAAMEQTDLFEH